jgi:hypothetical protein
MGFFSKCKNSQESPPLTVVADPDHARRRRGQRGDRAPGTGPAAATTQRDGPGNPGGEGDDDVDTRIAKWLSSSQNATTATASNVKLTLDLSALGLRAYPAALTRAPFVRGAQARVALTALDMSQNSGLGQSLAAPTFLPPPPLAHLQQLRLSRCALRVVPPQLLAALPQLTVLDLSHNGLLRALPESVFTAPRLRTLDITACVSLAAIPFSLTTSKLETLVAADCTGLSHPSHMSSPHPPHPSHMSSPHPQHHAQQTYAAQPRVQQLTAHQAVMAEVWQCLAADAWRTEIARDVLRAETERVRFAGQPPRQCEPMAPLAGIRAIGLGGFSGVVELVAIDAAVAEADRARHGSQRTVPARGASTALLAGRTEARLDGALPESTALFGADTCLAVAGAFRLGVRIAPDGPVEWAAWDTVVPELSWAGIHGLPPPSPSPLPSPSPSPSLSPSPPPSANAAHSHHSNRHPKSTATSSSSGGPEGAVALGRTLRPFGVVGPVGATAALELRLAARTPGKILGTTRVKLDGGMPSRAVFDDVRFEQPGTYVIECVVVASAAAPSSSSAPAAASGLPPGLVLESPRPTIVSAGIAFGTPAPPTIAAAGQPLSAFAVVGALGCVPGDIELVLGNHGGDGNHHNTRGGGGALLGTVRARLSGRDGRLTANFDQVMIAAPGTYTLVARHRADGETCETQIVVVATPLYWHTESPETLVCAVQQAMDETTIAEYIGWGRDSQGLTHTGFKVLSVTINQNLALWKRYCDAKLLLRHKLGGGAAPQRVAAVVPSPWIHTRHESLDDRLNELYLFHGTKAPLAPIIMREGFDGERVGDMMGMFGSATYLAEFASKSDEYVVPDADGLCYMFLCRTVLGDPFIALEQMVQIRRPPCASKCDPELPCDHVRHDSVLAETTANYPDAQLQRYREMCIYHGAQVFPEFLVVFQRIGQREPEPDLDADDDDDIDDDIDDIDDNDNDNGNDVSDGNDDDDSNFRDDDDRGSEDVQSGGGGGGGEDSGPQYSNRSWVSGYSNHGYSDGGDDRNDDRNDNWRPRRRYQYSPSNSRERSDRRSASVSPPRQRYGRASRRRSPSRTPSQSDDSYRGARS